MQNGVSLRLDVGLYPYMYVCVCVFNFVCMYGRIHPCPFVGMCIRVRVSVSVSNVWTDVFMHVCKNKLPDVSACVHLCVHVCMCVFLCSRIHVCMF